MKQQSGGVEKQKVNKLSSLLTQEENEQVFGLLGRRCQSMCTAVAQLYTTEPPAHSIWIKRNTGALCFVRDSSKRSYFIRIYCLIRNELVWEEEIYESIYINKSKEYLLDFEGRDCLIALNFASESEANHFYKIATVTISNRNKRRQVTKRRSRRIPPPTPTIQSQDEDQTVVLRNTVAPPAIQLAQFPQSAQLPQFGGKHNKKPTAKKLTKADISMPTDFKHVMHVGWTAQKGFDLNGEEVNSLNAFLEKAGVSEQQLNDRETRAFIYDFIQSNNVLDSVKLEQDSSHGTKQITPPPVPSRHHQNGTQRTAPPPPPPVAAPPVRQPPPPLPKTIPQRGAPPGRPPPITNTAPPAPAAAAAAPPPPPPPPPPPMMSMIPPPPPPQMHMEVDSKPSTTANTPSPGSGGGGDTRNALMDSIRKGATLKKVDPSAGSTGSAGSGDNRNDLLSEIQQGVKLRPAATRELGAQRESSGAGTDALADALRRALQERGRVLRSSDEDDDDDSENDGEWDD